MSFLNHITKNATLKKFDADVLESIIDKIMIGRRNEEGSIDSYEVRFCLKQETN